MSTFDLDLELEQESTILADTQKRPVRALTFRDPCGGVPYRICVYVNQGPHFAVPRDTWVQNVWHYELKDGKITVTPSIGLHLLPGHKDVCHLVITDQPVRLAQ